MNRNLIRALMLVAATTASLPAVAHALLLKAVPAVGGTIAASPADIRITYTEGVEPKFSKITLTAEDGSQVSLGAVAVDPADHATLIAAVKAPLRPGSYKVVWHVVSVDTHATQGSFSFVVKP